VVAYLLEQRAHRGYLVGSRLAVKTDDRTDRVNIGGRARVERLPSIAALNRSGVERDDVSLVIGPGFRE
jgi:hypothetical protein